MDSMEESSQVMSYATPYPAPSSYWGAAVLCLTGVGLMVVAGCFLVGVLILTEKGMDWQMREVLLATVLYVLCFGSAAGATVLLVMGARRALK